MSEISPIHMTSLAIGVDLGGTNLRAAVVDTSSGTVLASVRADTPIHQGPPAIIDLIVELVQKVMTESGVTSVSLSAAGIGMPGLVDVERGMVILLPNIPGDWSQIPLGQILSQRLGLSVRLINDARAITLAEWTNGAGQGTDSMACYAIGTGIGGGVVVGGRLHLGSGVAAGELGHQIVELNGLRCNCGGHGCLEMYASGPAIAARGVQAVIQRQSMSIAVLAENDLNRVTASTVFQAAREGDPCARAILEEVGTYIGIAVSNTIHTLNPQRVVFGGGVMAAGELLMAPIRRTVREHVFLVPVQRVELVMAQLGDNAGLIGAAAWAQSKAGPVKAA